MLEQGSLKSGGIIIKVSDAIGTVINPATEETLQAAIAPSGADTDFSVTLTSAVTAYALFAAPASAYELTIYNGSDTDIYIRKTIGTTLGVLLPAGGVMNLTVGANKQIFSYCASAGKILQGFYTLY